MTKIIIKLRWWIIGTCILLGISFAVLIPFSKTDPEIRNYVPASLSSRIRTDIIEKEFGTQDMVVILFSDSCILTAPDLLQIRKIDRDLSKITGVSDRISPFTIKTIKGEEGMMTAEPLVGSIPAGNSDIEALKKKINDNPLAGNVVFSSDFTSASITATIKGVKGEVVTLNKIDL